MTAESRKQLELLQGLLCLDDLFDNSGNHGMLERQNVARKSYIRKWKLLENVQNAERAVLDNVAIKDNANVDKKTLESYITQIKKALCDFNPWKSEAEQ
ncbi:hypothetical protein M3Y96_01121700 [Aphelenchoides besseyi]|nr:hypothetical protein M3Y96_01121700 [Aphelenchoides besseyi]